jgi:hypothetical protein
LVSIEAVEREPHNIRLMPSEQRSEKERESEWTRKELMMCQKISICD